VDRLPLADQKHDSGPDGSHLFAFDFGLVMTQEQTQQVPGVKEMIENPPGWLQEWSGQIGAELKDGLRETPSWIAFARENGTVYHTYTVTAPRSWRKDEYPE
jgi:hypothetical protein